jgi:glycosyltransferase involved in cell wall biosynthesis
VRSDRRDKSIASPLHWAHQPGTPILHQVTVLGELSANRPPSSSRGVTVSSLSVKQNSSNHRSATSARPKVVCVTPVRNEAWTLDRFLRCAETWADHIVLADQCSTDETRALAAKYSKVVLVENPGREFNDGERHRLVLEAARQIPGPRLILAVDADEALSAEVLRSPHWAQVLDAPPGTVITAEWINYLPESDRVWVPKKAVPIGFVDDGRAHNAGQIHVDRVAVFDQDPRLSLGPIKLLHFQYLDWVRMKSKQRRYQCLEVLWHESKRPVQIYRQYHRMDAAPQSELEGADPAWLAGYRDRGIGVGTAPSHGEVFWWDEEVLDMLLEHGCKRFRRIDIWSVDWNAVARRLGRATTSGQLDDPRSRLDRAVFRFLAKTQGSSHRWTVRVAQRMLAVLGW